MRNKQLFFFFTYFFNMKKIIITIILFFFSLYYLNKASYFIQENDLLMQEIKNREENYYKEPLEPIITKSTMIPGLIGKKINLHKSYKKMKALNSFQESLLIYDNIYPQKTIKNVYDKVIIKGNIQEKNISIIIYINSKTLFTAINDILVKNNVYADILIENDFDIINTNYHNKITTKYYYFTNYCLTYDLNIKKECQNNSKYTFLAHYINNYYLNNTKELLTNGTILLYSFKENNYNELNIIIKYLKNNNYKIVTLDTLIPS